MAVQSMGLPRNRRDDSLSATRVRTRRQHLPRYLELHPAVRYLLAVALVCAISLLYLMQTSQVASQSYRLRAFEAQRNAVVRDNNRLQLQIAELKSRTRIQQIARNKLGMVPLGKNVIYVLVDDRATNTSAEAPPQMVGASSDAPAQP